MQALITLNISGYVNTDEFPSLADAIDHVAATGDIEKMEVVPYDYRRTDSTEPCAADLKFTAAIMNLGDPPPSDRPVTPPPQDAAKVPAVTEQSLRKAASDALAKAPANRTHLLAALKRQGVDNITALLTAGAEAMAAVQAELEAL